MATSQTSCSFISSKAARCLVQSSSAGVGVGGPAVKGASYWLCDAPLVSGGADLLVGVGTSVDSIVAIAAPMERPAPLGSLAIAVSQISLNVIPSRAVRCLVGSASVRVSLTSACATGAVCRAGVSEGPVFIAGSGSLTLTSESVGASTSGAGPLRSTTLVFAVAPSSSPSRRGPDFFVESR